jgi:hypothetical protein
VRSLFHKLEVIVTKMGKPAVKISSYESIVGNKRLGLMKGKATIPDDFGEWTEAEAKSLGIIKA